MRQSIPAALRHQVIVRAHYLCEYCLVHEADFYLVGEVDHVKAIKYGGTNAFENLAYSCIHCNRFKGYSEAIVVDGRAIRLYNPRVDHWADHFEISTAFILAKTEIGEATIKVLKINSEERVRERLAFIEKGTYPHPTSLHLLVPKS